MLFVTNNTILSYREVSDQAAGILREKWDFPQISIFDLVNEIAVSCRALGVCVYDPFQLVHLVRNKERNVESLPLPARHELRRISQALVAGGEIKPICSASKVIFVVRNRIRETFPIYSAAPKQWHDKSTQQYERAKIDGQLQLRVSKAIAAGIETVDDLVAVLSFPFVAQCFYERNRLPGELLCETLATMFTTLQARLNLARIESYLGDPRRVSRPIVVREILAGTSVLEAVSP